MFNSIFPEQLKHFSDASLALRNIPREIALFVFRKLGVVVPIPPGEREMNLRRFVSEKFVLFSFGV